MGRRESKGKVARVIYLARGRESAGGVRMRGEGEVVWWWEVDACGSWVVSVDGEQAVDGDWGVLGFCRGTGCTGCGRLPRVWFAHALV